jgi:chromosomal replication initiator protein
MSKDRFAELSPREKEILEQAGFASGDVQEAAPSTSDSSSTSGSSGDATADASGAVIGRAWDEVLAVLQTELSGPTFNNYLRHIRPLALEGDRYVLEVPSEFVKDWLVRRFAGRIEATLQQFLGREVLLSFQTAGDAPPSTSGAPDEPPAESAPAEMTSASTSSAPEPPQVLAPPSTAPDPNPSAKPATLPLFDPESLGPGDEKKAVNVPPPPALPLQAPAQHTQASQPASQPTTEARGEKGGRGARALRDIGELEDFSSSPLNKKYTFDNFIVGRSNYVSHAASWAVANAPAKGQYNPLFIYGGVGLGKTHLMQAIGHYINKLRNSPAEIVYVSGENFLYQVVRCIREDRMTAFRRMYRNVDIWLVDDIQYICNAERTEVEFFHIFNTLYDQGKQIVICSDKPPKDLQLTESRLISRFEWGLITYIEPPDLEHRIAILQKRAMAEGVHVEPVVLQFLAEKIRSNIRSLEGSLTRLLAMASLDGRKINLDLASETVRYYSTIEAEPVKVEVDTIIQVVCEHYSLSVTDILGKKRNKEIVAPRQVAMYLAREMANMSYPDIGRAFSRDYTTVIHSYEKVRADAQKDSNTRATISDIRSRIHARS